MDFNHLEPLNQDDINGLNAAIQQACARMGAEERADIGGFLKVSTEIVDSWADGTRQCIPEEAEGHRIQTSEYEPRLIMGVMAQGAMTRDPLYTGKEFTGHKQEVESFAQAVRWVHNMRHGGEDPKVGFRLSKAWTGLSFSPGFVHVKYNGMAPSDVSDPYEEGEEPESGEDEEGEDHDL